MDYEYDIFLSYKRHPESREWVVKHFQPLLEFHVGEELGWAPSVFRDDSNTEVGATWPVTIGQALGRSRVLVALWTKTYFHSEWCTRELSSMLAREQDEGFRTAANADGLICPVVLHDCERLPDELTPIQRWLLKECFNVRMNKESKLAEALAQAIKDQVAPGVAAAIKSAPPWKQAWPLATAQKFLDAIARKDEPRQDSVPRIGR